MSTGLFLGLFFLIGLLAALGLHSLFFDRKDVYEWRKNMAARKRWCEMMEHRHE